MHILDPSTIYRPELETKKDKDEFRDYSIDENDPIKERVRLTYLQMHTNQTVEFVRKQMADWCKFDKLQMTVMEALELLNNLVDESDPDVDIPNIVHAFQTAESIRKVYPNEEWFQLTGLVHDLGKVMALVREDMPQWAVVGDTFPVGCRHSDKIVYRDTSFHNNPDTHNPKYNTKCGMYEEGCGLSNVLMSWGHDEYMYQVLKNHGSILPKEGLYVIRYYSFYPWHFGRDYDYLCDKTDLDMLRWVKAFNNFDLYTKTDDLPDIEEVRPYYQSLIDKYIPGVVRW